MSKPLWLWMALEILVSAGGQSKAGFRKLRADEAAWYTKMHYKLAAAVPRSFYNWEGSNVDDDFDAMRLWSSPNSEEDAHTGDCPEGLGKSEPYSCQYKVEFKMPEKQSHTLLLDAYQKIKDYNNTAEVAAALKTAAVTRLVISITTNVAAPLYNKLVYCTEKQPIIISLPVPASLALLGIRSDLCPQMKDGKLDMNADYYDNALIILGGQVIKKSVLRQAGGITEASYGQDFDWSKTGKMTIQNIVVSVRGNAADIKVALKLIDWRKLYRLIGK